MSVPIIIGFAVNGWNVYRALRREGVTAVVIDRDPASIYWKASGPRFILSEKLSGSEIIEKLNSLAEDGMEYVLISALEETIHTVNACREHLRPNIHLFFPDTGTVQMLLDKKLFYNAARSMGFPIYPMYFFRQDWSVEAVGQIRFPCVLKTRVKMYVHGLPKAIRVHSESELDSSIAKVSHLPGVTADDFLLQEWVPGGDSSVFFCMQAYDRFSTPVASFVGRKIRQWRPEVGGTSSAVACRDDEILAETTQFFRSIGMMGICSMEWKRSSVDGSLSMIEPTACRADYQTGVAVANGVNIPYALYCCANGKNSYQAVPSRRPVVWLNAGDDCQSARHYISRKELTWAGWIRSLQGPKSFAILDWRDPGPFIELAKRRVAAKLRRIFHR